MNTVLVKGEFQGEKLVFKGSKPNTSNLPEKLVQGIIQAIDTRFTTASPLVNATLVSSFKCWPEPGSSDIAGYIVFQVSS